MYPKFCGGHATLFGLLRPHNMTAITSHPRAAANPGLSRPWPQLGLTLSELIEREWQRLIVGPLLAVDRVLASSTGSPGSTGSVQLSSPAEIHELESGEQLQYLVENYSDAVYRVARSVVRDNGLAEDTAQEALLKAWQALPTYRGDAPLRNWVLRITHNTAVSLLRSRREEVRDPDTFGETATRTSVERSVEAKMAMSAFESALDELDELSRSIVVLREVESMSYEEIAGVLDVGLP
ncbi:MAG: RNA polymerase sigma factor, partial [Acidimicrobiales bacterium]